MMKRGRLFLRAAALLFLLFGLWAPAEAAEMSVRITLYDLASDNGEPVAVGRAPLLATERQAKLYVFSVQPDVARLPYDRDRFFVTRHRRSARTGAASFRVRHERIVDKRCTALEIRDYYNVHPGDTCEFVSERGRVRALLLLTE